MLCVLLNNPLLAQEDSECLSALMSSLHWEAGTTGVASFILWEKI